MSGGNEFLPGRVPPARPRVLRVGRGQRGFTIIEVVVAVIILALAYASILQNYSLALRNIDRVDKKRTDLFAQQLQFEEKLQETTSSGDEALDGEVFLEGFHKQVVILRSESGEFLTLLTERKF